MLWRDRKTPQTACLHARLIIPALKRQPLMSRNREGAVLFADSAGFCKCLFSLPKGQAKSMSHVSQKKAPRREGVEHKGLLQSVSEDDRPVTIVASARYQINLKGNYLREYFAAIERRC